VRLEEPSPRSDPYSDVRLHLAGTTACRLQPIRQLRLPRALRFRFVHVTRFTCLARTADDKPGKGLPPNDPGRLPSCPRYCMLSHTASMLATSGLNSLAPSAPFRLHSAVDRVSDATTSFELASRYFRSSCLATSRARDARCVRPTSASHHSTTSTRVSWVPDLVTGFPVLSGEVAFHDVASASAGPSLYPTAGDSLSVSPPTKDRSL